LLLDRAVDFAGPLHHTDTYQALIHDLIGIHRNQCTTDHGTFDLDPDADAFWCDNHRAMWSTVGPLIARNVREFKARRERADEDLASTIAQFTELQQMGRDYEAHTQIGTRLVNEIRARQAHELFKVESDCFLQRGVTADDIRRTLARITDPNDRLRLITVAHLCDVVGDRELGDLAQDIDMGFLTTFDSQWKIRNRNRTGQGFQRERSLWGSVMAADDETPVAVSLPVAQTVKNVISGNFDELVWGDGGRVRPYGHVYVFVIGPGSYLEYNGVMEVAGNEKATYGCTSIPRPSEFMEQFQRIGDRPDDVPQ
jgi:hypothetical protein